MSAIARHTAVVKGPDWATSAVVEVKAKTGPLTLAFSSLVTKSREVAGNVEPGKPVNVRIYETNNPLSAVGSGTALVASFLVAPGGQIAKTMVTSKFLRIETKGVDSTYKGGQSLNIDASFNGLPFHGQIDIEIHDGKTGLGFAGFTGQIGGATFDNAEWPEQPSNAS